MTLSSRRLKWYPCTQVDIEVFVDASKFGTFKELKKLDFKLALIASD